MMQLSLQKGQLVCTYFSKLLQFFVCAVASSDVVMRGQRTERVCTWKYLKISHFKLKHSCNCVRVHILTLKQEKYQNCSDFVFSFFNQ